MPIRLGKRERAGLGLIARLLLFAAVTYLAVHFLFFRSTEEGELLLMDQGSISSRFRTPAYGRQEKKLSVFGLTLGSMRTDRSEVGWDVSRRGKPVIWIQHGDEFHPENGTSVLPSRGTNYIDYTVIAPTNHAAWRFRVDHLVTRRLQVGPFRFKTSPRAVSYWSPVMTNTLSQVNDSNQSLEPNAAPPRISIIGNEQRE